MASLIERYGWHEWLSKTNFSFLIGASHPHDLVLRARQLSYTSLCVNDFDGVYGLARTHLKNREIEEGVPLKLHHGAEIHLNRDHEEPVLLQQTLVLIARSRKGYANLCRILSRSHQKSKNEAAVSLEELGSCDLRDLVAIQPMRGYLRRYGGACAESYYSRLKEMLPLYLSVSSHLHPAEDIWVRKTLELGQELEIPLLWSQDVFYHAPECQPMSDMLHAIRQNLSLNDSVAHFFPNNERHLHALSDIERRLKRFADPEIFLRNSCELAESCQFDFKELRYHYPSEMIPEGYSAQSYLEHLTWQKAKERLGEVPSKVERNLKHELTIIEKLQFADYFLTVWDIVRWAREQGILCQGRGSAANSSVCFVLGITSVDPQNFDLLFERFVSMKRGDPPDIDVDFEHERREEVIQYIYRRYGRARAAMVANVITYRRKGALRAVGKAMGVPEVLLSQFSRKLSGKYYRAKELSEVFADVQRDWLEDEELRLLVPKNLSWKLWCEMADRLRGFPRHLGIHSGGFIIAENHLDELVAQEPATMEGRSVVQWCKEDIEGLNFFKIDVLCLGMLTAIRKAFDLVEKTSGQRLELYSVPEGDERTYKMLQRADTAGTFQVESRAQMSMLPRLKPRNFYDLVIQIAIIRPGPIQGGVIHPFLKRREAKEPIEYPNEKLRPILKNTLGIVIFQEQAMRIAISVGDFTPGEADELRKNIGAWNISGFDRRLAVWLEKLERGLEKNNIRGAFKKQLMGQLRGFADYGFPESHAISFALIAYASCYLKAHYPAAFFTSVLNSQPMGFYSPHALLQTAQRDGVRIRRLSVNSSHWDNTLEQGADGAWDIRLGFRLVRSLSREAIDGLIAEREQGGNYTSFADFVQRAQFYRDDLTALASTDVFREFKTSRNAALWGAEAVPLKPMIESEEPEMEWSAESRFERVQRDFQSFRTSLWDHPAKIVKEEHWCYSLPLKCVRTSDEFSKISRNHMIDVFGMTLVKQAPPSAKGMVFMTLEDEKGFINLAFSPQVYDKFHDLVESHAYLCVHGRMQKSGAGHSVMVKFVYPPHHKQSTIISFKTRKKEVQTGQQSFPSLQHPRSFR